MSIKMYPRQVTSEVGCATVELNADNGNIMLVVETGGDDVEIFGLNRAELADVIAALGMALVAEGELGMDRGDVGEELAVLGTRLGAFED